ncbi:AAA family ATPase [Caldicellulosiruptor kronotskyensis]|uniref:AAA family ATPase n=1 Tax=Caldicellulosiruptor kronotskyensis TaxID=413889 RepID=UPI0001E9AA9F|nr:AAA family ATPase [Caldicellulosiruptor kronotskyensis]
MILKQLRIKNFRQFKGEQVISFPVDGDKNVIVVLGNNTAGKTTLIQAFYWVLYGKTNFKNKETLLNLEEANSMKPGEKKEVMVSLILVDRGIEYTITRRQQYEYIGTRNLRVSNSKIEMEYKDEQGNIRLIINELDIKDSINKILPEELSEYFFFDGERIGNLAKRDKDGKKELATAVRNILGLAEIANAIEHLSGKPKYSVLGMLRNSLDEEGEVTIKRLKIEIDDLEDRREEVKNLIKTLEDEIKNCEKKLTR